MSAKIAEEDADRPISGNVAQISADVGQCRPMQPLQTFLLQPELRKLLLPLLVATPKHQIMGIDATVAAECMVARHTIYTVNQDSKD